MKRTKNTIEMSTDQSLSLLANMFRALAIIADQERQILELKKEIAEMKQKQTAVKRSELLNLSFLDKVFGDHTSNTSDDKIDQA